MPFSNFPTVDTFVLAPPEALCSRVMGGVVGGTENTGRLLETVPHVLRLQLEQEVDAAPHLSACHLDRLASVAAQLGSLVKDGSAAPTSSLDNGSNYWLTDDLITIGAPPALVPRAHKYVEEVESGQMEMLAQHVPLSIMSLVDPTSLPVANLSRWCSRRVCKLRRLSSLMEDQYLVADGDGNVSVQGEDDEHHGARFGGKASEVVTTSGFSLGECDELVTSIRGDLLRQHSEQSPSGGPLGGWRGSEGSSAVSTPNTSGSHLRFVRPPQAAHPYPQAATRDPSALFPPQPAASAHSSGRLRAHRTSSVSVPAALISRGQAHMDGSFEGFPDDLINWSLDCPIRRGTSPDRSRKSSCAQPSVHVPSQHGDRMRAVTESPRVRTAWESPRQSIVDHPLLSDDNPPRPGSALFSFHASSSPHHAFRGGCCLGFNGSLTSTSTMGATPAATTSRRFSHDSSSTRQLMASVNTGHAQSTSGFTTPRDIRDGESPTIFVQPLHW